MPESDFSQGEGENSSLPAANATPIVGPFHCLSPIARGPLRALGRAKEGV
jgi:hypothetical protein